MEESIKLCPLKRNSNGCFGPCSGVACMAYLEFRPACPGDDVMPKSEPVCRMMPVVSAPYYGGCDC